ncbi:hypothetical protein CTAYLR_006308 [Chrysophaeum taylorii]|uniref:Serine aminopeptidase S33 domain-containing protein n=1 Tax=Chrysophaeum taylorii TaxID=2483200 RepID=A0AAD7UAN3_9STRA|nr:hypothetical protein CTAYLR_006308 [Chrysophaeum taylorii]
MGATISKTLVFQPPALQGTWNSSEAVFAKHVDTTRMWLQTRLGSSIEAFYIDRRARMTVLFSHANAEDITMIYPWLRELSSACAVNVLAYSYTGYAKSPGLPSEKHVYADARAAWDYLVSNRRLRPDTIVLYSRSIGSGAAVYLAQTLCKLGTPPAGLVLQSPVLSVFRIAFYFRITLPGDLFPNIDRIADVRCPVFVMHGTHDEVVPFWHGQELFLATPLRWRHKPFWIKGAGHNNIELLLRDSGLLFKRLRDFIDKVNRPPLKPQQSPKKSSPPPPPPPPSTTSSSSSLPPPRSTPDPTRPLLSCDSSRTY